MWYLEILAPSSSRPGVPHSQAVVWLLLVLEIPGERVLALFHWSEASKRVVSVGWCLHSSNFLSSCLNGNGQRLVA